MQFQEEPGTSMNSFRHQILHIMFPDRDMCIPIFLVDQITTNTYKNPQIHTSSDCYRLKRYRIRACGLYKEIERGQTNEINRERNKGSALERESFRESIHEIRIRRGHRTLGLHKLTWQQGFVCILCSSEGRERERESPRPIPSPHVAPQGRLSPSLSSLSLSLLTLPNFFPFSLSSFSVLERERVCETLCVFDHHHHQFA